ncbi:MAG TPA: hypothetical protein VGQ71_03555 [Terriglobales bacterium]|jgi:uncharacterized protein (DUF433 family)|nr:hypothetical protein [Terriglobales bacterium]
MSTVTARLEPWLEHAIREFWARHGEGPSGGLRRVAEEWWTLHNFRHLEFRDDVAGRRAAIRGGPDVWEVVLVARQNGGDRDALFEHFGTLVSREALDDALGYADRFPQPVEARIRENERVAELLSKAGP